MRFQKVGRLDYEVYDGNDELIGYLYKERQSGSGTSSRYIGYFPPYSAWVWEPCNEHGHRTFHKGEPFNWVKAWLRETLEQAK